MTDKPEFFATSGGNFYWKASPRLRPLLRPHKIPSTYRLPDEINAAYEACRERTADVMRAIGGLAAEVLARPPLDETPIVDVLDYSGWTHATSSGIYVAATSGGHIKIGIARQPEQRLVELQTGSPLPLNLAFFLRLAPGWAAAIEARVHRNLAAHRQEGEWFRLHPRLAIAAILEAIGIVAAGNSGGSHPVLGPQQKVAVARRRSATIGQQD